jgi:hypothetical protein
VVGAAWAAERWVTVTGLGRGQGHDAGGGGHRCGGARALIPVLVRGAVIVPCSVRCTSVLL